MGDHRAPSAMVVVGFAAAVALFTLGAAPARAQQPPPSTGRPAGMPDPRTESYERQQREAQLRSSEMLSVAKPANNTRAAEAAAVQMREDFKSIQLLRNKVVRQLKSEQPLDYSALADQTEEINKRAGRLRTQLVKEAPEGEKREPEKETELQDAQLTEALVRMCHRIDSFTENPVFKLPDVIDVHQTAKAERDLRDIIRLSASVNKTAQRLMKTRK